MVLAVCLLIAVADAQLSRKLIDHLYVDILFTDISYKANRSFLAIELLIYFERMR